MFDGRFHTYGALLDDAAIRIFYDGLELCRFPMTDYFKVPLYMCVTLAMFDAEKAAVRQPERHGRRYIAKMARLHELERQFQACHRRGHGSAVCAQARAGGTGSRQRPRRPLGVVLWGAQGKAEIANHSARPAARRNYFPRGNGDMYDFQEPEDFDPRDSMHPRGFPWGFCAVSAALIAVVGVLLWAGWAFAHDAPSGWTYPWACCSNMDCQQISTPGDAGVKETSDGYVIKSTGEVIAYTDKRVRASPDGEWHWCAHPTGLDAGHTICLFVPPGGS
jgi:hypothetical protein